MAIKSILSWALAVFFLFTGLVGFATNPITATALLLIGLVILPKTSLILKEKYKFDFTKKYKIIASISIFALFMGIDMALNPLPAEQIDINRQNNPPEITKPQDTEKITTPEIPPLEYKKMGYDQNNSVENYYLLVNPKDKSESNLLVLANEIKKEVCKKPCNIMLYDEEKAYNLDMEREKNSLY
jgi:hypothetical protein